MKPKIIFSSGDTAWSEVAFTDIAERISISETSGKRPAVEYEDIVSGEGILNKNIYAKNCNKKGVVFNEGDVLFGKLRPYLRNILLADFKGVAVGDFWVLRSKGIEPYILYMLVNSMNFMKVANISSGSKMPRADWNLISSNRFYISSSSMEQQQIASYFRSIDSLVSAFTSRLASLKQIKAASLQSMFPQEGETTPRIRFKGFEGEWKKVKLSSIAKRVTRKNTNLETTLPVTISAADGIVEQTSFFNNVVASSNLSGYYLIEKGEFAYNKSYSNGYPYGAVKRMERYDKGALSILYIVFKIDETIFSDYLLYFFETTLWHSEIGKRASEGARNHGLLNIGAEVFLDIDIMMPKDTEQQKIANYFKTLDRQITLQTRRLEKLKQIKAACLDKMFV